MSPKAFQRKLVLLYLQKADVIQPNNSDSREILAQKAWSFACTVAANEPNDVEQFSDARWAEYFVENHQQ